MWSSADTLIVGAVSDLGSPGPPFSALSVEGSVTLSPGRGASHSPPPSPRVPTAPGAHTGEARARQGFASASEDGLGAGLPGTALQALGLQGLPGDPTPLIFLPDRVTRGPRRSQAGMCMSLCRTSEAATQGSLDTTGQLTAMCKAHDPGRATFRGFGHPGLAVGTGSSGLWKSQGSLPGSARGASAPGSGLLSPPLPPPRPGLGSRLAVAQR